MRDRVPPLPPGFTPPQALRFKRVLGRCYVPDVVQRVRILVEGTTLPLTGIAARTGVGATTVHGWIHRRGWIRPPGASRSTRSVGLARAGFTRRLRDALRRVDALAARELAACDHAAAADRARALCEAVRLARQPSRRATCAEAGRRGREA